MMSTLRANTAAKPESLTAASPCARRWGNAVVVTGTDYANFMSILPSEDHQPQLRSVPLCTPAAVIGKHPGTEEWVDQCDTDHINFIIPGRHVD